MKLPYKVGTPVRLVSPYGYRVDPITGQAGTWHSGVDLVSDGDKTICAVSSGVVVRSRIVTDPGDRTSEWGNYVCIQTDGGGFCYYCHMERRFVSAGSRVNAGDPIGLEGSTGRSTGSHCHFEVRKADNSTTINAAEFLGIPNTGGRYTIPAPDPQPEAIEVAAEKRQAGNVSENPVADKQQDNTPAAWAADAVDWAKRNGIVNGDQNGNLKLHEPITLERLLVVLHRAFAAAEEFYGEG